MWFKLVYEGQPANHLQPIVVQRELKQLALDRNSPEGLHRGPV